MFYFKAMHVATEIIQNRGQNIYATLTTGYDNRTKSRWRTVLDNGEEVALILPRGKVLNDDDILVTKEHRFIRVQAAVEDVTTAYCQDNKMHARACYHMGNRHVAVQIGDTWLRYRNDHVLDAMLTIMGCRLAREQAKFSPEAGAYSHSHALAL